MEPIKRVREDLMEIFPPETDDPRFRYVRRTWIFPNHFDIAVDFARQLSAKYGADETICTLGALLHDSGLAYERDQASSDGHEARSVKYVERHLPTYGYDEATVARVVQCVRATELDHVPETLEEKVVRTADALSHILSIHYLAKAVFSTSWDNAIAFVERKIDTDYNKLCFSDEIARAKPLYEYYTSVIAQYRSARVMRL